MEEVAGSIPASSTMRSPNGEKAVWAFLLVRMTKSCVIPSGITGTKTVNGEETCLFISESEEVVRNTKFCLHDGEPRPCVGASVFLAGGFEPTRAGAGGGRRFGVNTGAIPKIFPARAESKLKYFN